MSQEEFEKDPNAVLNDPEVLIAVNDQIYDQKDAMAIVFGKFAYGKIDTQNYKSLNTFASDHQEEEEKHEVKEIHLLPPKAPSSNRRKSVSVNIDSSLLS